MQLHIIEGGDTVINASGGAMHHNVASLESDSSIRKLHLTRHGEAKVTITLQNGDTIPRSFYWYECRESADSILELYKSVTEQGEFFNAIVISGLEYHAFEDDTTLYTGISYGSIAHSHNFLITDDTEYAFVKKDTKMFQASGSFFNGSFDVFWLLNSISFGPVLIFDEDTVITPMDAAYHPYNGAAKWENVTVIQEKMDSTIYFL